MDSSTIKKKPGLSVKDGLLRSIKWEHLLAGISGGVVSTLILHPLDLVKIRFQVNEGIGITKRPQYKGLIHALTSIAKSDGFVGLYQGVTPNVWGAGISWGMYFFLYSTIKSWMQDSDSTKNLGPVMHLTVAAEAGFATLVLTNPIWVTKTRLCLQYKNASGQHTGVMYRGMVDALVKIYKLEGIQGLYKGFIPGVFGISHGALQFMAYEEMKTLYNKYLNQPLDSKLSSLEYISFAALSKMFAAGTTYPYQVVRSRLQDQHRKYNGVIDVVKQIWKFERLRGFYKGLGVYVWHVTPNICIVFLLYEFVTNWRKHEMHV